MITPLELIIRLINEKRLRPMKVWSTRYGDNPEIRNYYIYKLKFKIRTILNILSGNDVVNMLKCKNL